MASGEKKLTILNSYIGSLPDDALLYVVVGGVSYKITKAELLEGISGGTTPNFQQVTDVEGITTNSVRFDFGPNDYFLIDTENQSIIFYKKIDGVWTIVGGMSSDTLQLGNGDFTESTSSMVKYNLLFCSFKVQRLGCF